MKKIFFVITVILMAFAAAIIAGCQTSGEDISGEAFSAIGFQKKVDLMSCSDIEANVNAVKENIVVLEKQLKSAQSAPKLTRATAIKDAKDKLVVANKKVNILETTYMNKCKNVINCEDSDNGKNYADNGVCTEYYSDGASKSPEDYCIYIGIDDWRAGVLKENYCGVLNCEAEEVSCDDGQICRSGECREGDSSEPICEDSDDGSIYEKGVLYSMDNSGAEDTCFASASKSTSGSSTDQCAGGQLPSGEYCGVLEYYCSEADRSSSKFVECTNGCSEGACIE